MNKKKKVLVIILSVLLVISSLACFASLALRFGVASPEVYKGFLPKINAYSGFYPAFKDMILKQTQYMELPDEMAMIPEQVFDEAVPEDYFNTKIGSMLGGGIGWLMFNQEEAELPTNEIQSRLTEAINNNEVIAEDTGNLAEIMDLALLSPLEGFVVPDEYPSTIRGFIHYYFTGGNEQFQNNFDYYFDVVFYYYGNLLNWVVIGSCALTILVFVILLIVNKKQRYKTFKLVKIMLIVSASLNALIALFMLLGKPLLNGITTTYADYIKMLHPIINGLALVFFGYAMLNLMLALITHCVQKYNEATKEIAKQEKMAA